MKETKRTSIADLFSLQVCCEKIIRNYYREMKQKFSHLPEISAFWKSMVDDETQHIVELKNIRNSLPLRVLSSQAEPSITTKSEYSWLQAATMLNSIKTLDDAYLLAHEIEHSEVNSVFIFLTAETVGSDERRRFIRRLIETHLERLMSFGGRFKDRKWRKSISVKSDRK